jgi:3',5'-cyclic-AMP phosphodiesterase
MKQIAFITDVHLNEQFPLDNQVNPTSNFETVLQDMANRNITNIIFGGDIGEASAHEYFFEKLKPFSLQLMLGNHDKYKDVSRYYINGNNADELFYNKEDGDYIYIFLDTSSDSISTQQLAWLQTQLSTTKKILLFIHHPILAVDTFVDNLYPLQNRKELADLLFASQKQITIFCAHYHINHEQSINNITQIITQSLSFQLVQNKTALQIDNKNFGYRIITFFKGTIETEIVNFVV